MNTSGSLFHAPEQSFISNFPDFTVSKNELYQHRNLMFSLRIKRFIRKWFVVVFFSLSHHFQFLLRPFYGAGERHRISSWVLRQPWDRTWVRVRSTCVLSWDQHPRCLGSSTGRGIWWEQETPSDNPRIARMVLAQGEPVVSSCSVMYSKSFTILSYYCGSYGKESARNAGDPGSIPTLGRSPGERNDYPLILSWRIPWTEDPGKL